MTRQMLGGWCMCPDCVQFLYDESGVGSGTGAWLCVTLGIWHPYKQANTVVWNHWASRFLAPYFHHMVPGSNFSRSARLATIATFFTYIRLALPEIGVELQAAITTARQMRSKPLVLAYLLDLRDLLVFCIPVVCLTCASSSVNHTECH